MMRVAPCDTFTFPVTVAISIVQDPSLGTVTLPLTIPVKVPVQFVSARTVNAPPRKTAVARAKARVVVFITHLRQFALNIFGSSGRCPILFLNGWHWLFLSLMERG